jgi:hypothetical protein
MLSIQGQTFSQVFANLAADGRLDGPERDAARKVADWYAEHERLDALCSEAADSGDHASWQKASNAVSRHWHAKPFHGSHLAERPQEFRTLTVGDVKFTVAPYTTGATMNVGIDRHAYTVS